MATKKIESSVQTSSGATAPTATVTPPPTPTNVGAGSGTTQTGAAPTATLKGLRASLSAMAQGWSTVFPTGFTVVTIDGGYGRDAVVSQLDNWLADYASVDSIRAALATAVAKVHAEEPAIQAELKALKTALKGFLGAGNPQLVQFGVGTAKAAPKLSSEQLVVRTARANATRTLLGTKGKLQKAKAKNPPPQIQLVPQGTATAPAQSTAPAAATSPSSPKISG